MRFTALLLAMLAATAAHSHEEIDLPELPIPEIDQLFPVDDMAAAFRWADRPPWVGGVTWRGRTHNEIHPNRWHVVALSEGSFGQVDALLAGIQRPQNTDPSSNGYCDVGGRFSVYLEGESHGGLDNEILWTFGRGLAGITSVRGYPHHLLKNRFSVVGGAWAADAELRDTGFSMVFGFVLIDNANCAGEHTTHADGSPRHTRQVHWVNKGRIGPRTDAITIADLLDGNVAAPPAAPEQPADNGDDTPEDDTPEDDASNDDALAQLRAANDALRDSLRAAGAGAAALRGALLALQAQIDALEAAAGGTTTTITLVDTVEIVRSDTLHFCPPTDEERQDLFDAFTGLQDSTAAAPKAAAVRPSSWGAIKALMQEE